VSGFARVTASSAAKCLRNNGQALRLSRRRLQSQRSIFPAPAEAAVEVKSYPTMRRGRTMSLPRVNVVAATPRLLVGGRWKIYTLVNALNRVTSPACQLLSPYAGINGGSDDPNVAHAVTNFESEQHLACRHSV
jgi:hypothetical protein